MFTRDTGVQGVPTRRCGNLVFSSRTCASALSVSEQREGGDEDSHNEGFCLIPQTTC